MHKNLKDETLKLDFGTPARISKVDIVDFSAAPWSNFRSIFDANFSYSFILATLDVFSSRRRLRESGLMLR